MEAILKSLESGSDGQTGPLFGNFSFEDFIVGNCNRFAFISAVSVSNNLWKTKADPLLIWGKSGLGKTHLLKAMGNTMHKLHGEKRIVYTSAKDFSEEYYVCLRTGDYAAFRNKYRSADVLLVDDIQLLNNRASTEFYHTVQTLLDSGKQIVITADRMPGELFSIISHPIVNLLISGVMFEIQTPDYNTRKKLIQSLMKAEKPLSDARVCEYICENINANVSQLIYAYNCICLYESLVQDVDLNKAEILLRPIICEIPERRITADKILQEVSGYYSVTAEELLSGPCRWSDNHPRFVAIAVCSHFPEVSMQTIRKLFGNPHINERWILDFALDNPAIQNTVEEIIRKLEDWIRFAD